MTCEGGLAKKLDRGLESVLESVRREEGEYSRWICTLQYTESVLSRTALQDVKTLCKYV